MRIVLYIATSLLLLNPAMAEQRKVPYFLGTLKLGPAGCEKNEKCIIQSDFGYVDRNRIGWKVNSGFTTDGASIPRWARFFAGEPFEPTYLQAAVLHDWYSKSERPVYGWLQTQRMFREALLQSGVSLGKANLLFAGVLAGSGKWIWRMEPQKCDLGPGVACIQTTGTPKFVYEPETYGTAAYAKIFEAIKQEEDRLNSASGEDVERLVESLLGGSVYISEEDGVIEATGQNAVIK